ncbi:MAG: Lipolytic protein family [Pedosphaera sp.]|nr:Lipolytic protein family [Pedosphaera sp.]
MPKLPLFFFAALFVLIAGCCTYVPPRPSEPNAHYQIGESVVLAGEQPARLQFTPKGLPLILVRSTYRDPQPETIHYEESRDFVIDYQAGTIQRTPQSRIPDFSTNMLYGKMNFDHSQFPGYGNKSFFVYADYAHKEKANWPIQPSQKKLLLRTHKKLRAGEKLKIIAYGDSITAGGEATQPSLIYWQRWADELHRKYPHAQIEAINGATGGDSTRNGLERLQVKVLTQQPDLVLVAFGMNDNNVAQFGVPLDEFRRNLGTIVDRIHSGTKAEIILVSAFPPNPNWHFGSKQMEKYAQTTEQVAHEKHCAFADVYRNWITVASHKKPEDLLGNNINHPNDFGHWIYFRVLNNLGL